jgi:hypothetical protein
MLKEFKFFSEHNNITQFMQITTYDTHMAYLVPMDLYGNVLELAVNLYNSNENVSEDTLIRIIEGRQPFPIHNHIIVNEVGAGVMYQYKLASVEELVGGTRIMILYCVRFPDSEFFCNFRATHRIR